MFPVGSLTKPQVRREAHRLALQVAEKPDSQEICFVPDGDYASFVAQKAPRVAQSGAIVAESGAQLGTHAGVHRFTIGQRKGLGVSGPAPMYVLRIDADTRRRHRGPEVVARSRDADGIGRELGVSGRASGVAAASRRRSVIGTLPAAGARSRARRRTRRARVRRPAVGDHAGPGGRLLQDDVVVGGGWIE